VRHLAHKHGYLIHKSHQRKHVPNSNNYGQWMLVGANGNRVILGSNFDATLQEIEALLNEHEQMKHH
jgi:hypothetical protein